MSILADENTRLIVQGITGTEGQFHTERMLEYGTKVVAGVVPGRGGSLALGKIPVFNTMHEAVAETGAIASVIYVPAMFATDAALEAIDAGIKLIVIITEGIPTLEMMKVYWAAKAAEAIVIGPNCPGIISPGKTKIGIMPGHIHTPGTIGVISRSGTLTYEIVKELTDGGFGQSTCVGIGGDPIVGSTFLELLPLFEADTQTDAVVLIGEIGGSEEERAADFIKNYMTKPVVAFIAGLTAPPGKRMGHAGAIIDGGSGTAQAKIQYLRQSGIPVAERPDQICFLIKEALS